MPKPATRKTASNRPPAATIGGWPHRHLLQLGGMDAAHLRTVLHLTREYNDAIGARPASGGFYGRVEPGALRELEHVLHGRVIANLFFEDSTRTRVSFTVAARRLGAEVIDLTSVGSSVSKGETVVDTALNVAAMGVDGLVIRHRSSGAAEMVRRALDQPAQPDHHAEHPLATHIEAQSAAYRCAVINAGDGRHEHPTQGLLDAYTVAEAFDRLDTFDLSGLTVAIIGDVGSSRVARSDIAGMVALGARVICIGPPGLVPSAMTALGCEVCHDLDSVLGDLDVVNVLRIQFERHEVQTGAQKAENAPAAKSSNVIASIREYSEFYGINGRRAARMKKKAIIMHPGPINRGVELTSEVADSQRSMVLRQVSHGVAVRMAVMKLCIMGE